MINDLDNNLLVDEFSSADGYRTSSGSFTVIGQPLNPIGSPVSNPRSIENTVLESQPRTVTTITEPVSEPKPRTATTLTEPVMEQPKPRINPYAQPTTETTTTSSQEPVIDNSEPMIFGGGGGGAVQRTTEEEPTEGAIIVPEKKIIGLKPKLFYGLLAIMSIGGYIYFKSKTK